MGDTHRTLFWYWGRKGGGARYAMEMAREMAKHPDLDLHFSLSRQSDFFEDSAAFPEERCCHFDTYRDLRSAAFATVRLMKYRAQLKGFIQSKGIDTVYCPMTHLWNPLFLGLFPRGEIKYLLTVHDATLHPGEDHWIRRWPIQREYKRADAFVTLSQHVKEKLESEGQSEGRDITVIPHSVFQYDDEMESREPRNLPEDRTVCLLFFGRILKYKGLGLMLEAADKLIQDGRDVEVLIAGDGDLSPFSGMLQKLGDRVQIENRWIGEDEISALFSRADILVVPYVEASQSGVIPIALGEGLPSVVTPVGGLTEQITAERTGIVADSVSSLALSESLERLLCDQSLYRKLSAHCLEDARELSWASAAKKVADCIQKMHRKK